MILQVALNPIHNPQGPSTYTLQNCNLHNYYPKPKYLITGSFGPLGQQAQTLTLLSSVETFGLGGLRMFTRRSCGFRL